ncbi:hypothetical protein [Magnetospirillum sp. SS-4]|uniref:hypothetical protein n=1 Tax=Magnetospirillum sp. SS-4 TaxID=2681465 RepID=UPI0013859BE6|nr:hypothetical protein [Magnetospirillum sp. SS-4]CAA7627272.1 hypothetical protein MTBSS4_710008 [Magnetospirillum sp. SS-4]
MVWRPLIRVRCDFDRFAPIEVVQSFPVGLAKGDVVIETTRASILTMPPGPDIASYHDRKIVILERTALADWLDLAVPTQSLIRPLPPGTLNVEQVG